MSIAVWPGAAKVATLKGLVAEYLAVKTRPWMSRRGSSLGLQDARHARFAWLSHRLVRRNLPDLRRERVLGRFEIEACLYIHPERSAGLEKLAEPWRGIGRNGLFFACDAFDPGARHVQRGGDRVRSELKRNEKFLPQDFAGMNRR